MNTQPTKTAARNILLMAALFFLLTSLSVLHARSANVSSDNPPLTAAPAASQAAASRDNKSGVADAPCSTAAGQKSEQTEPATTPEALPLKGKKIVIDPGHGGSDPGATRCNVKESDLTLGIALKLKKILEDQGAKVVLTRATDCDKELSERCDLSNKERPDIFVSIHINASNNPAVDGIETYYYTPYSKRLAKCLFDEMVATLGARANWVHQRSLYVCRNTAAPSALVEVGYISNQVKRDKMATAQYQQLTASAIAKGIDKFFSQAKAKRVK